MNKCRQLLTILAIVLLPNVMNAASASLEIQDFTIKAGETKEMLIDVNNADMQVTMVEFFMYLPQGLSVAVEDDEFAIGIAGRTTTTKHTLVAEKSGEAIHVLLYSGKNTVISGTSGALISVRLVASSSFSGGDIIFEKQLLAAPDEMTKSKPATYTYTVKVGDDVTIQARSYTREYGEDNPTFGYDVTSGTITSGTPAVTCVATKTSPVGTYDIIISKGSVSNSTVNLVKGTLTITCAPLTISAGNYTKQEGEANPTFTPTFSGFKNGETKSVLTKQPTVSCSATTSSPAGTYPVTVSGAEAQNYSISYINGTLTVTPKPVNNITFVDAGVKRICVENWDTNKDGELSKQEAAAVTDLGEVFRSNKNIKSFNELQYFTGLTSIGDNAFYNCSGLTSVTIPNSVTSIGSCAFYGCSGLTSLKIGNSVTNIGSNAFRNCYGLTSVTIPNSVTSIGNHAFDGCSGLTLVTIGTSVTYIRNSAFYGCSGLTSITIPNSVMSIGESAFYKTGWYNNQPDGILYIDNWLIGNKGKKPTGKLVIVEGTRGLADYAFQNCSGLTSVTIPNSMTSIGNWGFSYCSGLTSVMIPNSVTSIGNGAFSYCSGLTSVMIPNSVTSIGNNAFIGCSGLTSVTIPNSVTSIGSSAFEDCSGLTSITIPNSVTSLKGGTFFGCSSLTTVSIPNSVTSIEDGCYSNYNNNYNGVFQNCSGLTSVTIPNSVTSIGSYAFKGCSNLTSVTIPNSVTSIGSSAFEDCSGLTSVTIPNSVTSIGNSAFSGCSGLTSVTIPNSLTSIENYTFYECSGLTSVTIPNSVMSIGNEVFYNCSGLTSVTIPNSVTSIGDKAFKNCTGLSIVSIPISVSNIGNRVFSGCSGLTSIKVESRNTVYDSRNNCNAIIKTNTNELISGCKKTAIPNSVTSIGSYAFEVCSGLTSVTIPSSVTSIGSSAFEDCSGLTSVTIPNSVTSIGNSAFSGCSGLTSVTIPNSMTSIGNWGFSYCSGLTSIMIGNSVTSIGDYVFFGCTALTSVTSLIDKPFKINENVFGYIDSNLNYYFTSATLYIPKGAKAKYETTPAWNKFEKIEEIEVSELPKGDVNGDNTVNVADIGSVIDIMAEGSNNPAADVNGDGVVNVADIAAIIDEMAARARRQEVK